MIKFQKVFIERNIGDHSDDSSSMKSADILRMFARKTQSPVENIQEVKKSEDTEKDAGVLKIFAGQSQGDFTNHVINNSKEVQNQKLDNEANGTENHSSMSGAAILQLFAKQNRQSQEPDASNPPKNFDPRSLFTNSAKKVPQNSDADSDE